MLYKYSSTSGSHRATCIVHVSFEIILYATSLLGTLSQGDIC